MALQRRGRRVCRARRGQGLSVFFLVLGHHASDALVVRLTRLDGICAGGSGEGCHGHASGVLLLLLLLLLLPCLASYAPRTRTAATRKRLSSVMEVGLTGLDAVSGRAGSPLAPATLLLGCCTAGELETPSAPSMLLLKRGTDFRDF